MDAYEILNAVYDTFLSDLRQHSEAADTFAATGETEKCKRECGDAMTDLLILSRIEEAAKNAGIMIGDYDPKRRDNELSR